MLCRCWRRQEHLFLNQQKDQASQLVNLQPERLKQIRHPQHQLEVLLHHPPHLRLLMVIPPVGNLNLEPNRLQKPRQVEISPTQIPPSPPRTMYLTPNLWKLILVHRQVWYITSLTWLWGFRVKIPNVSPLHYLAISRRDLSTKNTKPNIEKWPESLWVMLKFYYIERGLLGSFSKMAIFRVCRHLVSYSTFSQIILRHTFQYGHAMGQTVLKANSRVSKTKKIGQFPRLLSKNDKKKGHVIYTLNESSKSLQTIPPCIFYCGTTPYDFFFLALTKIQSLLFSAVAFVRPPILLIFCYFLIRSHPRSQLQQM